MVSVCMATFNGEKYLKEQIDSILINLAEEDELIISDDGSTDDTKKILFSYSEKDSRIKVFDGPQRGVVKNFENALLHCKGDYIFLSDQDDIWKNDKVELVLPKLKDNILVCHNAFIYNQIDDKIVDTMQNKIGTNKTIYRNIIKNSFIGCCMAFKKELLNYILPFPSDKLIHIHDWWIALIAIKTGNVCFMEDCLITYRIHNNNTLGFKKTSFMFKIKKRINMIKALKRWKHENYKENTSKS